MVGAWIQVVFWSIIFIVESYALYEQCSFKNKKKASTTIVEKSESISKAQHYIMTTMTLLTGCLAVALTMPPNGRYSPEVCAVMGMLPTVAYAIVMQAAYAFFLIRIEIVAKFERAKWYSRLLLTMKFITYVFVPFGLIPLDIVFFHGELEESTGYCREVVRNLVVIVLFIIGNTFISICLLILFIEPLRQNAVSLGRGGVGLKESLMRIVRRNLFLSSIAIVSSMLNGFFYIVVFGIYKGPADDYLYDALLLVSYTDLTVNCICAKLMTSSWLPSRLRQWFADSSEEQNRKRKREVSAPVSPEGLPSNPQPPPPGTNTLPEISSLDVTSLNLQIDPLTASNIDQSLVNT